MTTVDRIQAWRAVEALRAGVPNRDAVTFLGSSQPAIESTFRERLAKLPASLENLRHIPSLGLAISGRFGSGKSHLLEYLQHVALEGNLVTSRVVISKETPMYDRSKLFDAAVGSITTPDRRANGLQEITGRLQFRSEAFGHFFSNLNEQATTWQRDPATDRGLAPWFAATVYVLQNAPANSEVADRIIRFWSGDPLPVSQLRGWLRELGQAAAFPIRGLRKAQLVPQRWRFLPMLIAAAGYAGWVIFVDEAELVGQYSILQRAKSYAEMARLLGALETDGLPGVLAVLAIADNYNSVVLDGGKNDQFGIRERLERRPSPDSQRIAAEAERGMQAIRDARLVKDLAHDSAQAIVDKVRDLHAAAYQWQPPGPAVKDSFDASLTIRQRIKAALYEWDIRLLYPEITPKIAISEQGPTYEERAELEEFEGGSEDEPGGSEN